MRLEHFGDNYDITKRFLMECLAPGKSWGIIPMFTDKWNEEEIEGFKKLVGGKVLNCRCIKGTRNRQRDVSVGEWDGHVFIDPDTGVQFPDSSTGSTSHLRLNEIVREAEKNPSYLVLVFDQSYVNSKLPKKKQIMKEKLAFLNTQGVKGFGYLGQASFLVLSCDSRVLENARRNLLEAGIPACRLIS